MGEVNVGIIGCGAVAETCHLPAVKRLLNLRIKALADINKERAESLAERFRLEDTLIHTDYHDLLKESDVDAVWILTPPNLHAEMVAESLKYGKHVLCEKPLATSLQQTQAIRKALKSQHKASNSPVLIPAHNFIFTPCYSRAIEIARHGRIGKIKRITGCAVSNLYFYKAKTDFRNEAKGGVIEDQLPHLIYLFQDAAGPCAKVISVKPGSRGHSVAQDVNVEAELQGGVKAELSAAWSGFIPTLKLDLVGESGRISMDLLRRPYNVTVVEDGEKDSIRMGRQIRQYLDVLRGRHPSYLKEHKHFLDLVTGRVEPRVTVESGFELVRMLGEVLRVLDEAPMSSTERYKVSLVRAGDDIGEAVRESVSLLGGLKIREDANVAVKPNICYKKNTENMMITDPRVLESVLNMAREKTKNILVVESDNNSGTADERVEKSGTLKVIEDCGAEFVNLSEDRFEEHKVSGLTIRIPKTVLEADYLINVPKIKTCNIENTFISIAMKNMFGVLADKKKMEFHKNLTDVLLYTNQTLPPDLTIVDGVVAMEGLGPVWGTPVQLNLIVSGSNSVTVDAVCCSVMGINPYAIEVLWRAYRSGLGEIDISKVEVLGQDIGHVKRRFAYPVFLTKNITGAMRTVLKTYL